MNCQNRVLLPPAKPDPAPGGQHAAQKYRYTDIQGSASSLDPVDVVAEAKRAITEDLALQLSDTERELSLAERRAEVLRRARQVIFAELARAEHGISPGDTVRWEGRPCGGARPRSRGLTLRGLVVAVPMRDQLEIRRLNRHGEPMDQMVRVPAGRVERG